ncbi:MAG: transposase [Tannerellaceae bacterium]|nr:transposase [Tannerellaceae bacterium]
MPKCCKFLHRIFYVNNQLCYLSGSKVKNKDGIPELQIIVCFNQPQHAQEIYKERWQIEPAFRALKSSGFNIEDTRQISTELINYLPWSLSLLPGLTKWVFMSTQISKISKLKNTAEDRSPYSNTG